MQADRAGLSAAYATLSQGEESAATYGLDAVYTMLPKVGQIVRAGEPLYAINGAPAFLLYGGVPASRAFMPAMSAGADVAELNLDLRGYGAPSGDVFTASTTIAIERFQSQHHITATGQLPLGSVVFEPGAVRVTSVTPTEGSPAQAGPVLGISSTRRVVTIALDASQQSSIKVGDPVLITLPDNSTTPGRVSYVGTVATVPTDQNGGGSSSPTIEVDVAPDRAAATGRLDQAPVDVSITTATVRNVLALPVNALVALAGGGYAVEEVESTGVHQLVGVSVGMFDDAAGTVEVSGSGARCRAARGGACVMTTLELDTVTKSYGIRLRPSTRFRASASSSVAGRAGRDRRTVGLGQVDAAASDGDARAADVRQGLDHRARRCGAVGSRARRGARDANRLRVPAVLPLRALERARERRRRPPLRRRAGG